MDLTEAFHRFSPMVFAVGLSVLKSREDAEDLVQEIFTANFPRLVEQNPGESPEILGRLLAATARNRAIDHYRRRRRYPTQPVPEQLSAGEEAPEERDLEPALAGLEVRYQEVLTLKYLLRMSWEQVAGRLGISTQGARKRADKAKALLRARLEEAEEA